MAVGQPVNKKYRLVPPEGGWGYAVGFAVSLSFVSFLSASLIIIIILW